jgi:hypothetical protein
LVGLLGADAQTLELAILFIAQKTNTDCICAKEVKVLFCIFEGNFILIWV